MDRDSWERIGAATGVVFIALAIVAQFVVPTPPKLSELDEYIAYAQNNRTGLLTQTFLNTLAAVFALWFLGTLRNSLRRAEGGHGRLANIAYGGGLIAVGLSFVSSIVFAEAAFRADTLEPATFQMLVDVGILSLTLLWAPVAALIGATAMVSWRMGALPRWHAAIAGVIAVASVATPAVIYGDTGFFSIDQIYSAGFVMFIAFLAWVLATSIMLMVGEMEEVRVETEKQEHKVAYHVRTLRRVS